MTNNSQDFDERGKVIPDQQDYDEIERRYGPLPVPATNGEQAERYRLAQANKLIRLGQRSA